MIDLRPEQRVIVDKAKVILHTKGIVYIAGEVRTGKSPMGLMCAYESGWRRVCFITKKVAISGIEIFEKSGMFHELKITNYEQAHKLIGHYDGYIIDEAHAMGAHPKPSNRAKVVKELTWEKPVILMSGTPTPETYSQIYHQFWISKNSPFKQYVNFYKWAKDFVDVKQKRINGWPVNDYSRAKEAQIKLAIEPYMVHLSQEEAGFTQAVEERIEYVEIDKRMYRLMDVLKRDKIYTMKCGDVILADTPARLQSLFHQLSSGTVNITKFENEKEVKTKHILDESKAWFIRGKYGAYKIAILYKFIAEGELLRRVFPNHTDDPYDFNRSESKVFIRQIVSGREGVDLSTADYLIMYNIDFSATSYWQGRARMQTKDRTKAAVLVWIFSQNGIEKLVYKAVSKKKNFTLNYFKREYGIERAFSSFRSKSGGTVVVHNDNQIVADAKATLLKALDTDPDKALDAIERILKKQDGSGE